MLLLSALVAGSGNVWGQTWTKASSIQVGDIVVFVTEDATKELSGISTTSTKYGLGSDYDTTPVGTYPFTVVEGNSDGTFAFKNDNDDYLYWTSGNSLNVNSTLSSNTSWNVTFDSGDAILTNVADDTRQIWWNVGSPRFACYTGKSGQDGYYNIQIYKQTSSSYTVSYNGNSNTGGSAPVDGNTYSSGATVTVLGNTGSLTKTGCAFGGWNTQADGEGTYYAAGATFTITANTTLYAKWNPYTINAVSNNDSYGTVSGTTTITASPNSGYRVSTSTPYTVSPAESATVVQSGNVFTVTPTANTTVTINFEATPQHSVTVTSPTGGTVTIKNGEDVVASGSSVYEGTTLTITAAADGGKVFNSWNITGATPASTTDATTTFIVGSNDVTIAATFDAATTHAISWSVNGKVITENVVEGEAIDFSAPASGVPTGYTFIGWRTSTLAVTDTDPNDYVTSANSTTDITYYAVMAAFRGANDVLNRDLTGIDNGTTTYSNWSGKSASSTAVYAGNSAGGNDAIQLRSNSSNSGIVTTTSGGNARKVIVEWNNATASGRTLDIFGKNTDYSAATDLYDNSTKGEKLGSIVYGTSTELTISGDYAYIGLRSNSGAMYLDKITIVWGAYGGYCTTIPDVSVTVTAAGYATFCSPFPLDFTGKSIAAYIATTKGNGTGVNFTQVNKVPANTGVLLHYDGGTTENIPVFDGTGADATSGNVFVPGTGAAVATDGGTTWNYILNNVGDKIGFYKAAGNNVAANRAYISILKSETPSPVKEFFALPGFEDDATSIQNSKFEIQNEEAPIYNLAGQRLNKMQKGINIVNGKKIMVK